MVSIPSPLRSYTGQKSAVEVNGATLADLLSSLDHHYPGIRFRMVTEQDTIRPHIKIFINEDQAKHLLVPLQPDDRVHIICALSGG